MTRGISSQEWTVRFLPPHPTRTYMSRGEDKELSTELDPLPTLSITSYKYLPP